MNNSQPTEGAFLRGVAALVVIAAAVAGVPSSQAMAMAHDARAQRPPAAEFGLGPRSSATGRYVATLEPEGELRPRRMQTVRVTVVDAEGRAVDGATLTIEGGMPEHGHGLPTRPRVTGSLGEGAYAIEGVRFNMGGWWELKITIAADGDSDTVTFNLSL